MKCYVSECVEEYESLEVMKTDLLAENCSEFNNLLQVQKDYIINVLNYLIGN